MRTNYVLIDYENVQPSTLSALGAEHFKVIVFVGANQAKIPFELAAQLQRFGANGQYVKISGNGPNALDFHIAYYIGRLAASEPDAYFHIISKDTGFDPLIRHLKANKTFACRSRTIHCIPILKAATADTPANKVQAIVENFRHRGASRPRKLKTLSSTINSLFQNKLPQDELNEILRLLEQQGFVVIDGTNVTYSLPK